MKTNGIEWVFLETHNWGKAAKFLKSVGYRLEFETDHSSGQFCSDTGPRVFVAEIPEDRPPQAQLVLTIPDADAFQPDPGLEVIEPFEDTHYGTREMTVRDPDGRIWRIQAPVKR